jgi:hypothetical protein
MATKTIERAFPGKKADEIYGEVEKVLRRMGEKYGISCEFDAKKKQIVVPEKMGVKGLCTIADGHAKIELHHGMMGVAVVGTVKSYIEQKLDGLFS